MLSRNERDSSITSLIAELDQDQKNILHDFLQKHHVDESIALQFLYARKFDLDRAITLYEEYKSKVSLYEFENIRFVQVLPELKTGKLLIPGTRDLKKAGLLIFYAGKHEPDVFPPVATLALTYYLTRILIQDHMNQKYGITIIIDFSNMTWSKLDQDLVKMFVDFFQNGLPVRLKRVLLYRPPLWINLFLKVVSLFIKEKLRKRIILTESLDEWVDPANLPQDLSGQLLYNHRYMIEELYEQAKQKGEDVELAFDQDIVRFMVNHAYSQSTQEGEYEPYHKGGTKQNALMVTKHLLFGKGNGHLIDANKIMQEFYDSMNLYPKTHAPMKDNTPIDRITENLIKNRLEQVKVSQDKNIVSIDKQILLNAMADDIRTIVTDPTENQISIIPAWQIPQSEIKNSIRELIKREDSSGTIKTSYPEALFYPQSIPSGHGQSTDIKTKSISQYKRRTISDSRYLGHIIAEGSIGNETLDSIDK